MPSSSPTARRWRGPTEIADRIAAAAPLAVRACLANARLGVEQGWDPALAYLLPTARGLAASEDARQGEAAFREKRAARFEGR